MFNFLFDGKIGDILAPVVPSNQLFLAIQHHKNNEIQGLLDVSGYNPGNIPDGGYGAIHVACRYNNKFAVDLLLARGKCYSTDFIVFDIMTYFIISFLFRYKSATNRSTRKYTFTLCC